MPPSCALLASTLPCSSRDLRGVGRANVCRRHLQLRSALPILSLAHTYPRCALGHLRLIHITAPRPASRRQTLPRQPPGGIDSSRGPVPVLLDFGLCKRLPLEQKLAFCRMVASSPSSTLTVSSPLWRCSPRHLIMISSSSPCLATPQPSPLPLNPRPSPPRPGARPRLPRRP